MSGFAITHRKVATTWAHFCPLGSLVAATLQVIIQTSSGTIEAASEATATAVAEAAVSICNGAVLG